jgi:hypothetical protein
MFKLSLAFLAAALCACGSSQKSSPAPSPEPVANATPAADAAPAVDPLEAECRTRLARFGDGASTEAVAGCVAGFASRDEIDVCRERGLFDDYVACYPGCLGSVGIEPDPSIAVDDLWSDAVENCVFGCSATVCGEPE